MSKHTVALRHLGLFLPLVDLGAFAFVPLMGPSAHLQASLLVDWPCHWLGGVGSFLGGGGSGAGAAWSRPAPGDVSWGDPVPVVLTLFLSLLLPVVLVLALLVLLLVVLVVLVLVLVLLLLLLVVLGSGVDLLPGLLGKNEAWAASTKTKRGVQSKMSRTNNISPDRYIERVSNRSTGAQGDHNTSGSFEDEKKKTPWLPSAGRFHPPGRTAAPRSRSRNRRGG